MNTTPQRIIAHFDLDSFFVSVEVLNDPSLKGKAVFVGGGDRGVVAACSYEARKFGVRSGMSSKKAIQLCPHVIVIKGTYAEYSKYSSIVTQIVANKAPLFEKASIDEFYLDLTGMDMFFNPLDWTIALRQQIMEETKLPISFGMGSNKMIAKIATNTAKPNGYLMIPFGKEKEFLAPMVVDKIPGVGLQTYAILKTMGIATINDISLRTKDELEERLGKAGIDLWNKSFGIHIGEVKQYHEAKSISTENTFNENVTDQSFIMGELVRQTEKIAHELRQDGKVAGCISVKIRYPDFETTSRQTTVPFTSADDEIIPVAKLLFKKLYRKGMPIRLLGIRLSELANIGVQANIFNDVGRKNDLYKAIDEVKNRFGKLKIKRASST